MYTTRLVLLLEERDGRSKKKKISEISKFGKYCHKMYSVFFKTATTTTEDKIKVARYAWKHPLADWPNKYQDILDWLSYTLYKKICTEQEEKQCVWRCLHDILHTQKCHVRSENTNPLVLKRPLYQFLLNQLNELSLCAENSDIIIMCGHKVLTSPAFGHVWSANMGNLQTLLRCSLQLCIQQLDSDQLSSQLLQLLSASAQTYGSACRQSANPQQVIGQFCQKLFLPVATVFHIGGTYSGELMEELKQTLHHLDSALLDALFPKELGMYYESYLKLKTREEKNRSMSRFIDGLFTQISSSLNGENNRSQQAMLEILPKIYSGFVKSYLTDYRHMCFQFVQYLFRLLQIITCLSSDEMETETSLKTKQQVLATEKLLRIMSKKDVYNMATDHLHGDKQLAWLRKLGAWVNEVKVKVKSWEWFTIQRHLLELNYSTIEPNLMSFLRITWLLTPQLSVEARAGQADLMCDLVRLFTQLRQLPKIFTRLTSTLQDAALTETPQVSYALENCLSDSFQAQPISVSLTIWEHMVKQLKEHYIESGSSIEALCLLCRLLSVLLTNIRVIDAGVTQPMMNQALELLTCTSTDVLCPLMARLEKGEFVGETAVILQLAHSWGQLHIAMMQFVVTEEHKKDDIYVHNYMSTGDWDKLSDTVNKLKCPKCQYLWLRLQHQNFRQMLSHGQSDPTVKLVTESISYSIRSLNKINPSCLWNQQSSGVVQESLPIAVWAAMCDLLPVVSSVITDQQVELIANHIVHTLLYQQQLSLLGAEGARQVSQTCVTKRMIECGTVWEIASLVTAILKSVWSRIMEELKDNSAVSSHKKKKRRSAVREQSTFELITKILDSNQREGVTSICDKVCTMLESTPAPVTMTTDTVKSITQLLEVVDSLPLLYMTPTDQLTHLLCTLSLLSTTEPAKHTNNLVKTGLCQLHILYASSGAKYLCTQVSPVSVVAWLGSCINEQMCKEVFEARMHVFNVVYKPVTWLTEQRQQLHKLIGKFLGCLDTSKPDQWMLRILVVMLEHSVKILRRSKVPKEISNDMHDTYTMISTWLQEATVTWLGTTKTNSAQPRIVQALTLCGAAAMIIRMSEAEAKTVFVLLQDLCLELLRSLKPGDDPSLWCGCEKFVRAVSRLYGTALKMAEQSDKDADSKETSNTNDKSTENMQSDDDDSDSDASSNQDKEDESDIEEMDSTEALGDSEHLSSFIVESWNIMFQLLHASWDKSADGCLTLGQRSSGSTNQCEDIEQTLGCLVNVVGTEQLASWLNELRNNITVPNCHKSPQRLIVSLHLWTVLLECQSQPDQKLILTTASHHLLYRLHHLVAEISTDMAQYCSLVVAVLNTQAKILKLDYVPTQCVGLTLQTCHQSLLHDEHTTSDFVMIFTAAMNILGMILSEDTYETVTMLPNICITIRRALYAVMWYGRQRPEGMNDGDVKKLADCAQLMDRILDNLCTFKIHCSKIVAYLIADYTATLHKVTLLPAVKQNLLPGVFNCLSICSEHSIPLLQATLPPGLVEIFKTLYDEYNKYHKFTGRI